MEQTHQPITTIQVINSLDLLRIVVNEVIPIDNYDRSACPFCESQNQTTFNIYKKTSDDRARFHCFSCGVRGDVFNFIQRTQKITFHEAKNKIEELIARPVIPVGGWRTDEQHLQTQGLLDTKDKFCEKDCPKYAALREDYDAILEQSYTEAGVPINPDTTTIPALVNEIQSLRAQIKILEAKPRKPPDNLGGFGSPQCG